MKDPQTQKIQHESNADQSQMAVFVLVFLMLTALTGLSYWIAHSALMENRPLAWGSMIGVSLAKALLVAFFFMHLWWERAWKYVLTIPALMMGCMLVILLIPDIAMRSENYSQQRRMSAPEARSDGGSPLPTVEPSD